MGATKLRRCAIGSLLLFSTPSMGGLSVLSGNGTLLLHYQLWPFEFSGAVPYNVTLEAFLVPPGDMSDRRVDDAAAGRLVLISLGHDANAAAWADACHAKQCAIMIGFNNQNPDNCKWYGWVYWSRTKPFTTLPALISTSPFTDLVAMMRAPGAEHLHFRIDPLITNEVFSAFTKSISAITLGILGFACTVVNLGMAIHKLACFALDEKAQLRRIPFIPLFALICELFADGARLPMAINMAFCGMQCISWSVLRYSFSAWVILRKTVETAMGWAMHNHLYKGTIQSRAHRWSMIVLTIGVSVILFVDYTSAIVSALTQNEVINTNLILILYIIIGLPSDIAFVIYGRRVSRQLLTISNISPSEMARSQQFASRVAMSGVLGAMSLLSAIALAAFGSRSSATYFTIYMMFFILTAMEGILQIASFRPKQSIIDRWMSRLFRIRIDSTRTDLSVPKPDSNKAEGLILIAKKMSPITPNN